MLVYLSKKIAIPNDTIISSLAWHSIEGWLAVGGKNGLLRVLKLEVQHQDKDAMIKGLAAPSALTMNQTLEAHNSPIIGAAWNEKKTRLTTCDSDGLIVVWVLFKNSWTQEMINNRNKSAVSMVHWIKDGSKICIVYEDGAVIVGSVDGNRLWAKELKDTLTHVQWSPDGKVLLFCTAKGEIQVYDSRGTYNFTMTVYCLNNCSGPVKLIGLDWYNGRNGYVTPNCPCLAVVFNNGRIQLMKDELDTNPVVVCAENIQVAAVAWNYNGSILAVAGDQLDRNMCVIHFYNITGKLMATLRLPGKDLSSVAWEGTGLRLAVGIGMHVYFANVRHDYQWGHFLNTLVYSYRVPGSRDDCCMFWDTSTNECYCKSCHKLLHIASSNDYCLLATRNDNTDIDRKYALLVCNSLGIPVDSKFVPIEPTHVFISSTHVIAVIGNGIFVWHYRTTSRLAAPEFNAIISQAIDTHDRLIHVDDVSPQDGNDKINFAIAEKGTLDPVSAVCASDKVLIVGRNSGTLQCYTLPHVSLDHTFSCVGKPRLLSLNCDSTRLSFVNDGNLLSMYALDGDEIGNKQSLERKEVWSVKWAQDNPQQFAIMEKTRMYIFRGLDPEEPIISSASICSFKELQVKSVLMDVLVKQHDCPSRDIVFNLDTKSLRDTRQLLNHVSLQDSFQFIQDNPHPRLWQLFAQSAIEKGNYEFAEKAFVCCHDYQGIQFTKRLKNLDTVEKKSAEVLAFLNKFDDAQKTYIEMDRKDLALNMRTKLGDWFKVYQLLKMSGGSAGDDTKMISTWNAIGDYYAERLLWSHAVDYYSQAGNVTKMAESYYVLEEYSKLETLVNTLPENHALLETLADQFASVGMCSAAVKAYLKCHKIKPAVDCCIELNQWDLAVSLADKYGLKEVAQLLENYAKELLQSSKILLLIQLYRKAKQFGDAAVLLHKVAKLADQKKLGSLKVKKIHVLSSLMIEEHHKHLKQKQTKKQENSDRKQEIQSTLQGLLAEESGFGRYSSLIDNGWKWAESQHLCIVAQSQLYNRQFEKSMKTLLVLQSYTDVINPLKVFSLLALASIHCSHMYICSQALSKLEGIAINSDPYESLAVAIFKERPPRKLPSPLSCPSCDTPVDQWSGVCTGCSSHLMVCMSSGRLIQSFSSILCSCCGHRIANDAINTTHSPCCTLCHFALSL